MEDVLAFLTAYGDRNCGPDGRPESVRVVARFRLPEKNYPD